DLGNVAAYVSSSGAIAAAYAYDAFGRLLAASGPLADAFPHRFATKPRDPETGLDYYGYRFYSPDLCRWLNRDPIGERGGSLLFSMVHNNLFDNFDFLGLEQLPDRLLFNRDVVDAIETFASNAENIWNLENLMRWELADATTNVVAEANPDCEGGFCYTAEVVLTFVDKTTPPDFVLCSWYYYNSSSDKAKALWDSAYKLIKEHELKHVNILNEWREKLNAEFSGSSRLCDRDAAIFLAESKAWDKSNEYYRQIVTGWFNANMEMQETDEKFGSHVELSNLIREYKEGLGQ
ncbi:MAG: RHS repeat-associated core domain-containing protein, partial [Kiritimatiellae bacterium]|nr:RHS repeat-associated core domain-containing protein [Kiritimatiellia bacterium]